MILDRRNLTLEYTTDCIVVRAQGEPPRTIPLSQLNQLVCLHSVNLTTQLLGQLQKRSIDFIVLNQRHHEHSFGLYANRNNLVLRRCAQYNMQVSSRHRLELAKAICKHKFHVSSRVIKKDTATRRTFKEAVTKLSSCSDESSLRGLEGAVQKQLFKYWRACLPLELGFIKRQRRPPPDPVNAVLSLTYTLVHDEAVRQCIAHGLDSQLGFYHRPAFGRHSLACDIIEPLRPKVESWVIHLFTEGRLNRRNFSYGNFGCYLGKSGRSDYYGYFELVCPQWRRSLAAHARWLVRHCDDNTLTTTEPMQ